jgi:hypothetical protein
MLWFTCRKKICSGCASSSSISRYVPRMHVISWIEHRKRVLKLSAKLHELCHCYFGSWLQHNEQGRIGLTAALLMHYRFILDPFMQPRRASRALILLVNLDPTHRHRKETCTLIKRIPHVYYDGCMQMCQKLFMSSGMYVRMCDCNMQILHCRPAGPSNGTTRSTRLHWMPTMARGAKADLCWNYACCLRQ